MADSPYLEPATREGGDVDDTRAIRVVLIDDHSLFRRGVSLFLKEEGITCLLYTSPSPRDRTRSRMPSSA